jgi:hypothetical protein
MKKALYATAGSALALILLAANAPAFADVNVTATINKTKDITVTEQITINKTVTITVASSFTPRDIRAAAEANALLNVTNTGNIVDGIDLSGEEHDPHTPGVEFGVHLNATMTGGVTGNTGVFGVNQDVGNMVNQGNAVSIAGVDDTPSFANAQAEADQVNTFNTSYDFERLRDLEGELIPFEDLRGLDPSSFLAGKVATIDSSINDNTGIINVNQNAGNMNNQSNGVAVAIGLGALVALSESALGQTNAGNFSQEIETVKHDDITGSINGNTGVVNVNQSVGNMNNQGNVVSIAAIASGAILGSAE